MTGSLLPAPVLRDCVLLDHLEQGVVIHAGDEIDAGVGPFGKQPVSKTLLVLDSGCLWGGSLTAVRLEDRRVFQMPCGQSARPGGWE